jgi:hypothetical protein
LFLGEKKKNYVFMGEWNSNYLSPNWIVSNIKHCLSAWVFFGEKMMDLHDLMLSSFCVEEGMGTNDNGDHKSSTHDVASHMGMVLEHGGSFQRPSLC